ncbi:MAG: YybH family protein [Sphingosinicella sp.]|uniref:YybH family protein n=1 Tax=Sphingosinicella sp. TaxID=1917971 RepID=UPI004037F211
MNRVIIAAAAAASLALLACEDGGATKNAAADVTSVQSAVRTAESQWLREWQARDLNRIVARYSPDAMVKFTPTGSMIGPDAIRTGIAPFLTDTNFQIQFAADEVRVGASGDLASTRGSYSIRYTNPATRQAETETGTYVTVWQRQTDGTWRVVEDITSGNPTAPPS